MRAPTESLPRTHRTRRLVAALAAVGLAASVGIAPSEGVGTSNPGAVRPAAGSSKPLGPVLFIGDSVGASIASRLRTLLTAGNYLNLVDATSGRCTLKTPNRCSRGDAWDVMDNLPSSFKPTIAVIELGFNDTRSALTAGIDLLMRDLVDLGVEKVYWINLSERRPSSAGSVYAPSNDILAKAARKWSQLSLLDWNSASAGSSRTSWFIRGSASKPDLIHLTSTGQQQFASWIRSELDRLRDAGELPGSEAAVSTNGLPTLRRGSRGEAVKTLQRLLDAQGYTLRADGVFGAATVRKVKAFQRANGLTVDGVVGPVTWGKLGPTDSTSSDSTQTPDPSSQPVLQVGSSGDAVKALQGLLTSKGFRLRQDGDFGPATERKVKAFQLANGLLVDGIVGPATWRKLTS